MATSTSPRCTAARWRASRTSAPNQIDTPARSIDSSSANSIPMPRDASPASTCTGYDSSARAATTSSKAPGEAASSVPATLSSSTARTRPSTSDGVTSRMRSAAGRRRWPSSSCTALCIAVNPS